MDLRLDEPVPLFDALLRVFKMIMPCSDALSKQQRLVAFLISLGISPSAEAATAFFVGMGSHWAYDRPQQRCRLENNYLRALLDCKAISLDTISIPAGLFVPPGWFDYRFGDCAGKTDESILPALVEGPFGFEGLKYCLFHHSQSWTLEELSGRGLWYIATFAHADEAFQKALRTHVFSFRSNMSADEEHSLDTLMESVFDIKAIVSEVESAMLKERSLFIRTLISKGTPAMVRPFLSSTIDLDEGPIFYNYLGSAAANENMEVFKMLLAAGASSARALQSLCQNDRKDSQAFNQLLEELLENLSSAKDQIHEGDNPDLLTAIIESDRVMAARPDAPRLLLSKNLFTIGKLHGSDHVYPCHSYVFGAIFFNHTDLLEGLLEHGPPLDRTISEMFATDREHFQGIKDFHWLTLAAELGRSDCVRLVLARTPHQEHAIYYPDGAGRTPLQIARSSVATSHPRKPVLGGFRGIRKKEETFVSAHEDGATLQVIQAALDADVSISAWSENRTLGNEYKGAPKGYLPIVQAYFSTLLGMVNAIGPSLVEVTSKLLHFSPKGLIHLEVLVNCTSSKCATCIERQLGDIRRSQWTKLTELTFVEACLVRLSYVLMIGMILVCDIIALCVSAKGVTLAKLPRPSWVVTSLAMLFLLWISMKQEAAS